MKGWCEISSIDFVYEDDFGVNDTVVLALLKKLNASETDLDPWQHQDDVHRAENHLKIRRHGRDKFFVPVRDTAVVKFFDKDEYHKENLRVIQKSWSWDHVVSFLRVVDMAHLTEVFKETVKSGYDLTNLTSQDPVEVALKYNMTLPEVEDLFNCIDDLGGVDNLELIKYCLEEIAMIREEKLEVQKETRRVEEMIEHRKAKLPKQWHILNNAKGAGVLKSEFDVLMVGTRTVGKSSLIESFQMLEFNPEIQKTSGVKPVEFALGMSVIRFWDMSGKILELPSTKINNTTINVMLLVYDVTDFRTFQWLKVFLEHHEVEHYNHAILVGNKVDLLDDEDDGHEDYREVFTEDAEELCAEFSLDGYFEVSAKSCTRVHEAISDALLKSEKLKEFAPLKPKGMKIGMSSLDWGIDFKTLHLCPACIPK